MKKLHLLGKTSKTPYLFKGLWKDYSRIPWGVVPKVEIFDNLIMDLEYRFDYLKNKLFPYWDLNQEWKVTNNHKMIKEIED